MAKRAPLGESPYRPLLDPKGMSGRPLLDSEALSGALKMSTPGAVLPPQASFPARSEAAPKGAEGTRHTARDGGQADAASRPLSIAPIAAVDLVEKLDNEKRILMTRAESMALERLVASLAGRLNTQVKSSHLLRALVMLALNAEGEIDQRSGEVIGITRPANGDGKALQRFEKEIARIVGSAIRDAGPLR